ncbi:MAG: leucine-rich repeat domain-containing protein [Oscillospiraceae bacterium]|nr:leucine-rich repeat domain-containing protein [Oscillospiraceae bacterium]
MGSTSKLARAAARLAIPLLAVLLAFALAGCEKKTAYDYIEDGEAQLSSKDYDKAIDSFAYALEMEPENTQALAGLADAYIGAGQPQNAADVYVALGRRDEAAALYEGLKMDDKAAELYLDDYLATYDEASYDKYLALTDYEVDFADPAVESMVREYLGRPEGAIMRNELNDITDIRIYGKSWLFSTDATLSDDKTAFYDNYKGSKYSGVGSVKSLSDFRHFAKVDFLLVYYNSVTEIDPALAECPRLHGLYINYNYVSDLSPLRDFKYLTKLGLSGNGISDLGPLKDLTQLKLLYLQNNDITDLAPLADLTNLETLLLSRNDITDVSPLAGLTQLRNLYLDGNSGLTDASVLKDLTKMEILTLGRTGVKDYSFSIYMPNLDEGYLKRRTA